LGIAPIGHIVRVAAAGTTEVNIGLHLTLANGVTFGDLSDAIRENIEEYFLELRKSFGGVNPIVIRISQIENRLLQHGDVIDIGDTAINGVRHNLIIDGDNVPILGTVTQSDETGECCDCDCEVCADGG
jgi:hypothetical protein